MSKRWWAAGTILTYGSLVLAWALAAGPAEKAAAAKDGKAVFGLTKVWHFDLHLAAAEWKRMQPTGGMRFPFGPGGPGRPPEKPAAAPADVHQGSGFSMEFPWAHADWTTEGKTFKNLGIRFKGNASYMASARGLKRNLKLSLDHFARGQRFHGLKTLNLNAGAMDSTMTREALSFAVFRAAGVPAPRTAYAEVMLTVPGKYDKEMLGLYTVIEQVDRTVLKDRFRNGKGLLMKPERADTNKDGTVTLDELIAAAAALFKEADKDKSGTLDEKEVASAINLLFPPPPGFGGPGPRPPAP